LLYQKVKTIGRVLFEQNGKPVFFVSGSHFKIKKRFEAQPETFFYPKPFVFFCLSIALKQKIFF
jgi:hypothetical protein